VSISDVVRAFRGRRDVRVDHVALIEERRHARRGAEVVRLADPADGPLRRRPLGDAGEGGTGLAQVAEAPVADLVAGVAAVELDRRLGLGDLLALIDADLSRVALDAAGLVVLPREHWRLVELVLFPTPRAALVVHHRVAGEVAPWAEHVAPTEDAPVAGPALFHRLVRRDMTGAGEFRG